jgi:hypothetical protein
VSLTGTVHRDRSSRPGLRLRPGNAGGPAQMVQGAVVPPGSDGAGMDAEGVTPWSPRGRRGPAQACPDRSYGQLAAGARAADRAPEGWGTPTIVTVSPPISFRHSAACGLGTVTVALYERPRAPP